MRRIATIIMLSFLGLFVLKRTARATPEFAKRPDIIAPAERIPSTNNSLMIMLEAQLGIRPTNAESTLARKGLLSMRTAIFSSPIICDGESA